jgi:hypothetical protein
MKKFLLSLTLMLIMLSNFAQPVVLFKQNFDASLSGMNFSHANRWQLDSNLKKSPPYSMRGIVPSRSGDSIEMITPWIDASNYSYLLLTFDHICKVSESDIVSIEYEINRVGAVW